MPTSPVITALCWMLTGANIALLIRAASTSGWRSTLSDSPSLLCVFWGMSSASYALRGRIGIILLLIGGAALVRFAYLHDQRKSQIQ